MLQFNTTVCNILANRFTPRLYCRFTTLFATNSTVPTTETVNTPLKEHQVTLPKSNLTMNENQRQKFNELKEAVYNSLKTHSSVANKIRSAQNLHDLLNLIKLPNLSQKEVIHMMNIIMNFTNSNKQNVSNAVTVGQMQQFNSLHEVKGVQRTEDTKNICKNKEVDYSEYSDLSTAAMVVKMSQLAEKKDRPPRLIKFLCDNILMYNTHLSYKQCSSLLFSMCRLLYTNNMLLDKISSNLMDIITAKTKKLPSVVKSMSILRYKNEHFLNHICDLLLDSSYVHSCKDITSILLSFALLGFDSSKISTVIQKFMPSLTQQELEPKEWLNFVWTLVLLNNVQHSHLESVLCDDFVTNLTITGSMNIAKGFKLLNINGAAQHIANNYSGPFLNVSKVPPVPCSRTKQKESYMKVLQETLEHITPPIPFKADVNTNMGFFLDVECCADTKVESTSQNNMQNKKIGLMLRDYYDYCLESKDLQGIAKFQNRLLSSSGYKVLNVSYEHFGVEDTLDKRVNYLTRRIQSLK